jgi:hypothetical protein
MSRKTVPVAGSEADPDLKPDFSFEELWAEIDREFGKYEERQPGDIDYHDIVERYGITENSAHNRMNKLVKSGKYRFVKVKGNAGAPIRVIRRI